MAKLLFIFLVCSGILSWIKCEVNFTCDDPPICLGKQLQYQCTVSGSTLSWRISGETITTRSYTNVDLVQGFSPIGGTVFSTDLSSPHPNFTSDIQFTVEQSINGSTIECISGNLIEICVIDVPGFPASPKGITVHTDSFTDSSVNISWTESSSPCVTRYRYNVSSTAIDENIIMESISNSVIVEGLMSSDDPYTVIVTAIDTANRTNDSDSHCFIFDTPTEVMNITASNSSDSDTTTVMVTVTWDIAEVESACVLPSLTGYVVSLTNFSHDINRESDLLPMGTTDYTFNSIPMGVVYNIRVISRNGVGDSSPPDVTFEIPGLFIAPSITSSVMQTTTTGTSAATSLSPSTSTSTRISISVSPTEPTSDTSTNGSPPIAAIAGGVAGGIIFILLVIIVVLLLVYCLCVRDNSESVDFMSNKRGSDPIPLKETKHRDPVQPVRAQQPETGQGFYQDPNTIERKQAPTTGDLYAMPDKSKRRPPPSGPEPATYQDPNTIQREQAHTGDMYALPERKPVYTKVNKDNKTPQATYAELDLEGTNPTSPSPLIPPTGSQQQVMYSDVRSFQ